MLRKSRNTVIVVITVGVSLALCGPEAYSGAYGRNGTEHPGDRRPHRAESPVRGDPARRAQLGRRHPQGRGHRGRKRRERRHPCSTPTTSPPFTSVLRWDGAVCSRPDAETPRTFLNGKRLEESAELKPGDEVAVGSVQLVVGVAVPPSAGGRRALTHHEFRERLYEEVARATRAGRSTSLAMIQAQPGEGGRDRRPRALVVPRGRRPRDLRARRARDPVARHAGRDVANAWSAAPRERGGRDRCGRSVSPSRPEHGDNAERLLRAARARSLPRAPPASPRAIARRRRQSVPGASRAGTRSTRRARPCSRSSRRSRTSRSRVLVTGEASSGKGCLRARAPRARARAGTRRSSSCHARRSARADERTLLGDGPEGAAARARAAARCSSTRSATLAGGRRTRSRELLEDGRRRPRRRDDASRARRARASAARSTRSCTNGSRASVDLCRRFATRPEDIVPLAERFAQEYGAREPVRFSPGALARLRSYPWPGNVLELRNAMERAVRLADGGEILAEHLPSDVLPRGRRRAAARARRLGRARRDRQGARRRQPQPDARRETPRHQPPRAHLQDGEVRAEAAAGTDPQPLTTPAPPSTPAKKEV